MLASLLIAAVYILMAAIRDLKIFMGVAALGGPRLDAGGFRALGGGSAGHAGLDPWAAECGHDHGLSRWDRNRWPRLGCCRRVYRVRIHAAAGDFARLLQSFDGRPALDRFHQVARCRAITAAAHSDVPTAPGADDGPIAVVAEIKVDEEDRKQFLELMRELRLAYLRNGASSVRLYESLANHSVFRMEAVSPTWQEHLVLHRRMTKTERDILDRVLQLHTGEEAAVFHYVLITKEIASPKPRSLPS